MSVVNRGVRNAFRNTIRTGGVTVILALSIGLALVMLLSLKTVQSRIDSVKAGLGNAVTISPAGFNFGSDANNALTTSQLSKVSSLAHVTKLTETLTDRLPTTGSSMPSFGGRDNTSGTSSTTSLTSPVKLNQNGGQRFVRGGGNGQIPANFTPPVGFLGTTDPTTVSNTALKITSGSAIDASKDTNKAMVSTDMASKNNLKVGSTFQAYNATLTVAAIFDSGTQGGNDNVIVSLPALQRLTEQSGVVTAASAQIDSVDNLDSATAAIKDTLGSDTADVENSKTLVANAIEPLQNIKSISAYSLIGALVAGSVIIFLTMMMIVRERRREIGVLKAIGASNFKITSQFVVEAMTLTLAGAVVGVIGGLLLSNPILNLMATSSASQPGGGGFRAGGGGGGFARMLGGGLNGGGLRTLHTIVGYDILLYGLGAALLIAVIGSALPSYLIAKVRPAEVMRGE